jgi:hypothetical protein
MTDAAVLWNISYVMQMDEESVLPLTAFLVRMPLLRPLALCLAGETVAPAGLRVFPPFAGGFPARSTFSSVFPFDTTVDHLIRQYAVLNHLAI